VRPDDLMRNEEAGWTELNRFLHGLTTEQLTAPGYTDEGWSIKDMMWHIAAWSADAASHFERMRAGTFDPGEVRDTHALNEAWFEVSRGLDLRTVKAEWHAARTMMVEHFGEAGRLPAEAEEWFDEAGGRHYGEHLADLRGWVERLTSSG
jgi:Mycothiol maleylpyruvate isomerase N-terminal domain